MKLYIKDILLNDELTKEEKEHQLKEINNDIEQALQYLKDYTYCPKCNDWYRTNSFEKKFKMEKKRTRCLNACEWDDDTFIESDESYIITICPKGHEEKQRFIDAISQRI